MSLGLGIQEGAIFASRYQIVRRLAAGAMGTVYEVVHLETQRRRALKLMHPHIVESPELRARFRLEARVAAHVQSEFIVDVFDAGVDETTGVPFLVMELLRGEELGQRLKRLGRFSQTEAMGYLHQTALALDQTHRGAIVHRDLKPSNLFLAEREHGPPVIKVLDFGIAKLLAEGTTGATATMSMGTPLYMSPEQLRSQKVTGAADIFALGMMTYTFLVGVEYWAEDMKESGNMLAFGLIAVHGPREPASARAARRDVALPPAFDLWFRKITAPLPGDRFASATEAIRALAEILGDTGPSASLPPIAVSPPLVSRPPPPLDLANAETALPESLGSSAPTVLKPTSSPSVGRRRWILGAGAVLGLSAVGGGAFLFWPKKAPVEKPPPPPIKIKQLTFFGNAREPSFSPNGRYLAYVAGRKLMSRDLSTGVERELIEADRLGNLAWFPDSASITFQKPPDIVRYAVPPLGGPAQPLINLSQEGSIAFSPKGTESIPFSRTSRSLVVTDRSSGQKRSIGLQGSFAWLEDLAWAPSRAWILMLSRDGGRYTIWSVAADGSSQQKICEETTRLASPRWAPGLDAVYCLRGDDLIRIDFDPLSGKAVGAPRVLMERLEASTFSVAEGGKRLVYVRERSHENLWLSSLEGPGLGQAAAPRRLTSGTSRKRGLSVSPDGKQVAFIQTDNASALMILPIEGGNARALAPLAEEKWAALTTAFSPDGAEVAFANTEKDGSVRLFRVPVAGGAPLPTGVEVGNSRGLAWAPGRLLLCQTADNQNFALLDPTTGSAKKLLADPVGWPLSPRSSPDGKLIAVFWNRSEQGLWVIPVEGGPPRQIAPGELTPVGFRSDGQMVYALSKADGKALFGVPLSGGETRRISLPFEQGAEELAVVPGTSRFVCSVAEADSDLWLVDDFDPT